MAMQDGASIFTPTRSRSITETVNGSHNFTITGYSLAKGMGVGRHIASRTFSVGGYQWAIYFYPDGKNPEDNSIYVSVFIALASEGTDVRALFELTLVDQSGRERHKVHSHFDRSLESGPYTLKYRGSMWGYKRFFRRAVLESSDYLKDDTLQINCTVGVVVSATQGPKSYSIPIVESDLGQHFGALLDNGEATDVVFDVNGQKFHAHKLVMAVRSTVFKSLFLGASSQGQNGDIVYIEDIKPDVFKAMLHFIYRDTLPDVEELTSSLPSSTSSSSSSKCESVAEHLLAAADRYGLHRLTVLCESRICRDISVDTVASTLALAERCHATQLKAVCLKFAAENLAGVMQSKGFNYLKENCPLLQSELLKTVAGFEEESSIGAKNGSVWGQLSDGTDTNSRRLRPTSSSASSAAATEIL
eukprot:Gb_29578 [translate_table: standard]